MADWYEWAYCIAEAIEKGSGKEFIKIYKENTNMQYKTIIDNTDLAQCLLIYTEELKINDIIEIKVSTLFEKLIKIGASNNYFNLPKSAATLTKAFKRLITTLKNEGLEIKTGISKTDGNYISIKKVKKND